MGFFSYECKGCGRPMISSHRTNNTNDWMTEVVVFNENQAPFHGWYDGYGRVINEEDETLNLEYPNVHECWHVACYEVANNPSFTGPSKNANCQGYFYNDPLHDVAAPTTPGQLEEIKLTPEKEKSFYDEHGDGAEDIYA